jgi:hypothetical protein
MQSNRRALLVLVAACGLPLSVFLAHELAERGAFSRVAVPPRPRPASLSVSTQDAPLERPTAAQSTARPSADDRRIGDALTRAFALADEETPVLKTARDVDRYLDVLETRARRSGAVTVMEVQPGVEAISGLARSLDPAAVTEKIARFTEHMARLSAELDRRDTSAPSEDLGDLRARVRGARDQGERRKALDDYARATSTLPEERRLAELAELNTLASQSTNP